MVTYAREYNNCYATTQLHFEVDNELDAQRTPERASIVFTRK